MAEINNIKPPLQPDIHPARNEVVQNKRTGSASTSAQQNPADKVSLNATLSQLAESLAEVPVVDAAKVEAIKQDIESGNYQIDSQELARKMIDFEGDL
ncbi:MAG: hypothetical protein Kow0083_09610 [Methylophaga sp.]|jgi:negative regulator of flagellin synthesis FlgM